jgi:hypothetical protein
MAHWAEVDENNTVVRVTVGNNDELDEGYQWLLDNLGGTWIKTSYNATTNGFRKNYAGIGYIYDKARDAFYAPQPFVSWTLDEDTCTWQAPTPYPVDNKLYMWVEENLNWQEVTN